MRRFTPWWENETWYRRRRVAETRDALRQVEAQLRVHEQEIRTLRRAVLDAIRSLSDSQSERRT